MAAGGQQHLPAFLLGRAQVCADAGLDFPRIVNILTGEKEKPEPQRTHWLLVYYEYVSRPEEDRPDGDILYVGVLPKAGPHD